MELNWIKRSNLIIYLGNTILITFIILFSLLSNAYGENNKLSIYVDNSYPPYMYGLEGGGIKADGLYPKLIEAIIKKAGLNAKIQAYPWKRALMHGDNGSGAVGGAYKNDERIKKYDFSNPLYQEKIVVFVNTNRQFKFNSLEDLKGKVVGVNRGWSYGQKFDTARENKLFEVDIANNSTALFTRLAFNRIDCIILDKLSGEAFVKKTKQLIKMNLNMNKDCNIITLSPPLTVNNAYLMIPKKLKMSDFLKKFNQTLAQIHKDGTYEKIAQSVMKRVVQNKQVD